MHESNPIAIVALPLGIGEARQRLKWACRSRFGTLVIDIYVTSCMS